MGNDAGDQNIRDVYELLFNKRRDLEAEVLNMKEI